VSAAAEPISVRIARLKGCAPRYVEPIQIWECTCGDQSHDSEPNWQDYAPINYLTPAASFALLAELIDEGWQPLIFGWPAEQAYTVRNWPPRRLTEEWCKDYCAPTLGEAIALAWIAAREGR